MADLSLTLERNFAACWVNCWLLLRELRATLLSQYNISGCWIGVFSAMSSNKQFKSTTSSFLSFGWIWWLSLTPRRLIWTNSSWVAPYSFWNAFEKWRWVLLLLAGWAVSAHLILKVNKWKDSRNTMECDLLLRIEFLKESSVNEGKYSDFWFIVHCCSSAYFVVLRFHRNQIFLVYFILVLNLSFWSNILNCWSLTCKRPGSLEKNPNIL